ncbi:unnamed protein product [Orchesella dallaii]|uniref:Uncharacterized protein n=1 Tax=Orchesella dallaii TaxID=48710 RepID=A0ABP1RU98_9HEXA
MLGHFIRILFVASLAPGIIATGDSLMEYYPDARSCLIGVPQNLTKAAEEKMSLKESCLNLLSLKSPDENLFCYKLCILENKVIIRLHEYVDAENMLDVRRNESLDRATINLIEKERAEGRNYSVVADYATQGLLELSGVPQEKVNWVYHIIGANEETKNAVDNLTQRLETCRDLSK